MIRSVLSIRVTSRAGQHPVGGSQQAVIRRPAGRVLPASRRVLGDLRRRRGGAAGGQRALIKCARGATMRAAGVAVVCRIARYRAGALTGSATHTEVNGYRRG